MQPGSERWDLQPPMSIEEWAELDEDVEGEWVDGYLVEEEVAGYIHEVVVSWLTVEVGTWLRKRGGLIGGSTAKFAVSSRRGRMPDLSVYLPQEGKPPGRGLIRVPPSIMVEVVSARPKDAKRDRVDKLAEYAAFGVRYYWIVDPQTRLIEIYELGQDQRYVHAAGAAEGAFEPPGCPELVLPLDALWAEVAELEASESEPG